MKTHQKKVLLGLLIIVVGGSVPLFLAVAKAIVMTKDLAACAITLGLIGLWVGLEGVESAPIKEPHLDSAMSPGCWNRKNWAKEDTLRSLLVALCLGTVIPVFTMAGGFSEKPAFEYKMVEHHAKARQELLNEYSKEGWELAAASGSQEGSDLTFYLKRKIR